MFGQKQLKSCVMAIPLEGVSRKVCQNRLDKFYAFVRNLRRITVLFLYFSKIVVEMKTSRSVGKLTLVAFLEDVWWSLMPGVL